MGDAKPGTNGGGVRWLQPLMFSILVPGVVALVTVVSMATRYGEQLEQVRNNAESRWDALNGRLATDDTTLRNMRLMVERQDQRLDGLMETLKNRQVATDGRAADYGRQLQELRTDLQRLQITLAGMEAMLGYSTAGPRNSRR